MIIISLNESWRRNWLGAARLRARGHTCTHVHGVVAMAVYAYTHAAQLPLNKMQDQHSKHTQNLSVCSRVPNRQKMCGVSATDRPKPGAWREARRAKRALRKFFGISMPFCLIACDSLLFKHHSP
jgi:hypothetical protein